MPSKSHWSGRADQQNRAAPTDRTNRTRQPLGTTDRHRYAKRPGWPGLLALAIGVVYTVITIASAIGAPETRTLGHQDLIGDFGVSWVLILVHAGTAAWGLLASMRRSATKVFGVAMFVAYLGLLAYSVPAILAQVDYLNTGWGNAILYAITAAAGLAISIGASAGKPFPQAPPEDSDEVM